MRFYYATAEDFIVPSLLDVSFRLIFIKDPANTGPVSVLRTVYSAVGLPRLLFKCSCVLASLPGQCTQRTDYGIWRSEKKLY